MQQIRLVNSEIGLKVSWLVRWIWKSEEAWRIPERIGRNRGGGCSRGKHFVSAYWNMANLYTQRSAQREVRLPAVEELLKAVWHK
jgi:hypothetical protein